MKGMFLGLMLFDKYLGPIVKRQKIYCPEDLKNMIVVTK